MSGLGCMLVHDVDWARLRIRGFDPGALMGLASTLEHFALESDELEALCRAGAPRYWAEAPDGGDFGVFFHPEELRYWLADAVVYQGQGAA
ncbi:hypothetical protein [Geothrix sp. PMB-07]|uniref:hypothetical protein n=1 Tax=Geothrix sp. PMB-07 TaxID=3068640 RepID=UPI002740366B|nr:hypothetical protein [Geothrix sp. PMB-07]WLT31128.1 hypothetical protein Q9293_15535 [Geothrix sp. PMB-07]